MKQVFTQGGWSLNVECNGGKKGKVKAKAKGKGKKKKLVKDLKVVQLRQ